MTRDIFLSETATLRRSGAVWEAVLITPGKGSSGDYTAEVLQNAGFVKAFPVGAKNWFKHKEWRGEQRDPRDQWGYLAEDARYEEGVGLVAKINILPHWVEVVEALAEAGQAELSIYAAAAVNEETGELISILPAVTNSVDLVDYPGRPGSRLAQKIERARESYKPAAESSAEEKETHMDEKDIRAIATAVAAAIAESIAPVVGFVTAQKTAEEQAAQAKVDDQAIETAVESALTSYDEKVEAIEAAELLEPQVAELRERARKGEDITSALESAKKVVEAAKAALAEASGDEGGFRISERSAAKPAADILPKGW